jgi:hypothetical protein
MPVCQVTRAQMFHKRQSEHKKNKKSPKKHEQEEERSTNHSQELPMSYRQFHKATIPICDNKKFLISAETAG